MKCNTNVVIYKPVIKKLSRAAITALEKTGEELHTQVVQAQVIPFKTGNLQNEGFSVDHSDSKNGVIHLNHSTPYARRLYYHPEYQFDRTNNSNARGHWFDDWISGSKKKNVQKAYAELYKKDAGLK